MFITSAPNEQKEEYFKLLQMVASLSRLFSDNQVPYLYYRVAEKVFCRAFKADDLGRDDSSVDARLNNRGFGLKTFMDKNGNTFQKIAEFNESRIAYSAFESDPRSLIPLIAGLRNKRLNAAKGIYGLNDMLYHCVTRAEDKFYIFEEEMSLINTKTIQIDEQNTRGNIIIFKDNLFDYKFNLSKSTLFKRFSRNRALEIGVEILDDPFEALGKLLENAPKLVEADSSASIESVILPLYSRTKEQGNYVPEKSGLNQWNAGGRPRAQKEVYIRIPSWINNQFESFFPGRDQSFDLILPTKKVLSAKLCQANRKALMSNPNTDLGDWLINDVLQVPEGEILTYDILYDIGIDSVEVTKIKEGTYTIAFKSVGSYDDFEQSFRS